MSELPPGIEPADPPDPRPSAAGIVLRRAADGWTVLLGTRSRRSRFMPGHLAFPGGALDPGDRREEAGSFRRAVARELDEEAAFRCAPDAWVAAGERTTPPMFPVRFRTLFFVADAGAWTAPAHPPSPEELDALEFHDPRAAIAAWERGSTPLPPPVVPLLRALAETPADAGLHDVAARLAEANAEEDRTPRIEFVPGLWMTPVRTATLPPATHTNVWMPGRRRFALVDPGCRDDEERRRLLRTVERRRAAGGKPAAVLLTHEHGDHVGGAVWAADALGVPLHGHPRALAAAMRAGAAEGTAPPQVVEVADGDRLDLDGTRLQALHTPGHAPGHVAWWNAEAGWLLAGDLLSGISTILVLPDGGDMDAYLASLERVRALGPRRLLPAHGPPLPAKALDRLIAHRIERERKVMDALDASAGLSGAPVPLAGVARAAYPELPDAPAFLVESQTLAHLVRLERQGRARRAADGGWLRADGATR